MADRAAGRLRDTRYNRQELIPRLGVQGQARLRGARVVVIGAGGVKSPLLYYLAAAGVGHITIIDFDRVELSNLNRQILFTERDIGRNKAMAARNRLRKLNSDIELTSSDARLQEHNVDALLSGAHVVVEGGDTLRTRLAVNRWCVSRRVPMVHASARHNYGYVFSVVPGQSACFECVFPDLRSGRGSVPVLGIATGLAGVLGASEVIKIVSRVGKPVLDGLLGFSGFASAFEFYPAPRRPSCRSCGGTRRLG
jgi:molybdopterin/thiamine biosynthesis adenylyltransferase